MTRLRLSTAVLVLTVISAVALSAATLPRASAQEATQDATSDLTVTISESEKSTLTGDRFSFTSEITNNGPEATTPLIANLAFTATDGETYVDPEDWSGQRTQYIDAIEPGASATQTWTVKTVISGDVAAYVAVLPNPPTLTPGTPLAVSPALQMHVTEERKLNPGGVLPTVLGVPLLLALGFIGLRVVRRRIA